MQPQPVPSDLSLLISVLDRLGITIRYESGESNGGFMVLHNQPTVLLNRQTPLVRQIAVCILALQQNDLSTIHLPPRLRTLLGEEDC